MFALRMDWIRQAWQLFVDKGSIPDRVIRILKLSEGRDFRNTDAISSGRFVVRSSRPHRQKLCARLHLSKYFRGISCLWGKNNVYREIGPYFFGCFSVKPTNLLPETV